MGRIHLHIFYPMFKVNVLLSIYRINSSKRHTGLGFSTTVKSLIATTSRKRPPPVSDHFVVPQGWSLARVLTVFIIIVHGKSGVNSNFSDIMHTIFSLLFCLFSSSAMEKRIRGRAFNGETRYQILCMSNHVYRNNVLME